MADDSKLSYDPSKLSKPVSIPDEYMQAALVEQRAIRQLLTRIATALETMANPPIIKASAVDTLKAKK
jgi:hypothetical protein